MIARRAVFADPRVTALLARFVPAADEVGRLQRAKDPEALLFQKVAEQGHYAGRTVPTSTRQGLYATTAGGTLLASINHNDPARVAAMLEKALAAWEALPAEQRVPADGWDGARGRQRLEARYPVGGLVLRVISRDLPRPGKAATANAATAGAAAAKDWRAHAWNLDYAWFKPDEMRGFLPPGALETGARYEVPRPLADRIVRLHLLDNVRGQTYPAPPAALERVRLTAHVSGRHSTPGVQGLGWWIDLQGEARWSEAERGVEVALTGGAHWDDEAKRFDRFDLLAHGTRWGATQYNARHDDLDPAPIAWLFELAADTPAERVAPASIWQYGWN